ncbi:hypothetical protein BWQ96_10396 [Gracilariopsis chorda]|uniref:Uncharacterized protein n=1 Tax=Gracilariopsis chorda TaxID=448386 RepID=A0A2V3ICR8_9FLOR|nr:hypothetical protein BWQ96_10396 [Gracilariopsis chorda]|eukprot:PXF39886.1 hypothetical protein BWQ96_10396 [Gracilariopsis chorda]
MTERVDLGDDDDSGVEGVFSGDEERQHTEEIVPEDHEFLPTGEIDAVPIVGSDTPSSTIPFIPIVHKRPKRHVREEADIMELFKASLQDREFRMAERERLQIEREEDRARSMVEANLRKEQLEEEQKARQEERDEAGRKRDEDSRNRE